MLGYLSRLVLPAILGAVGFGLAARAADLGYLQRTQSVAPHVWLLAEPSFQVQPIGNVTVIEQADGLVLVDAGGSPGAGRRIVAMVRSLSPKPVKTVVLTHWHGDHVQGLSEILKAWPGAQAIATDATAAHLRDPKTMNSPSAPDPKANAAIQAQVRDFAAYAREMGAAAATPEEKAGWRAALQLFDQYGPDMDGVVTLAPARAFTGRMSFPDPRAPVEVRFFGRANTDGDAVVWLPRQRVLVTGDVVVAPFPFGYGSYPAEWSSVLADLERIPFRTLVPGHGAPQHDRAYLRRLASALAEVRARVAPLAAKGVPLDEARKQLDFTAQAQRFVGADPWLRRWFKAYWTDPIVTSAYKEVRGEPIVQSLGGS